MKTTLALYDYAERHGVQVDWFGLAATPSLSVQFPDGSCAIAIDPWQMGTLEEETVCLAHELGHCQTGSFYDPRTRFDVRQRHENRADKWAIERLVSADDLDQAVADGCCEMWQLAERFGVTEQFMRKIVCWHTHGNLAVEYYM